MIKEKAFTLIELLVVIALIGLLASIVLVTLKGLQEKARITRGFQFGQSIHHSLGAYAVGVWGFEIIYPITNITPDASGHGKHGTVNGAVSTSSLPSLGKALYFDGVNDYVDCGESNIFEIQDFSFSVWIYPYTINFGIWKNQWIIAKYRYPDTGYMLGIQGDGSIFRTKVELSDGTNIFQSSGNFNISANRWHHLAYVYNGEKIKYYIDGKLDKESSSIPSSLGYSSTQKFIIGRRLVSPSSYDEPLKGLIDEVRIYNVALTAGQIQKHYVEGLKRLKLTKK